MVVNEPARARLCIVEAQAAGGEALARYQAMLESVAPKLREGRIHNPRASRLPDGLEVAIVGGLIWLVHQRLVAGPGRRDQGPAARDAAGDADALRGRGRGGPGGRRGAGARRRLIEDERRGRGRADVSTRQWSGSARRVRPTPPATGSRPR